MSAADSVAYGGGVQSNAVMVLAARREIDFTTLLFANTGDDSENPATLAYVRDVAMPYAERHGLILHELSRTYADGRPHPTLFEYMTREGSRSIPIPMRMRTGAPASRTCTVKWKKDTMLQWRKEHGATAENPCRVAIGFSVDEIERSRTHSTTPEEAVEYPLLDLKLSRADCEAIIRDAGLPIPPKSACWFCPWMAPWRWADVRRDDPARFEAAADLEEYLSDRSRFFGNGPLHMTSRLGEMRKVIPVAQATLFPPDGPEGCDEGPCWT